MDRHDQELEQAFDRQAAQFENAPVQTDPSALSRLVAFAAFPAGARVLDAGCGPGLVAEALLAAGLRVHGVDLSAEMVRRARQRCAPFRDRASFEQGLALVALGRRRLRRSHLAPRPPSPRRPARLREEAGRAGAAGRGGGGLRSHGRSGPGRGAVAPGGRALARPDACPQPHARRGGGSPGARGSRVHRADRGTLRTRLRRMVRPRHPGPAQGGGEGGGPGREGARLRSLATSGRRDHGPVLPGSRSWREGGGLKSPEDSRETLRDRHRSARSPPPS
jgi:SAM-dependent methyltransferase